MKYLFFFQFTVGVRACAPLSCFRSGLVTTTKKRKDSLNDAFVEHVKGIFNVDVIRDHLFLSPERSYKEAIFTEAQW